MRDEENLQPLQKNKIQLLYKSIILIFFLSYRTLQR